MRPRRRTKKAMATSQRISMMESEASKGIILLMRSARVIMYVLGVFECVLGLFGGGLVCFGGGDMCGGVMCLSRVVVMLRV